MQRNDNGDGDSNGSPGPDAPPLVRCFWCERLHSGSHPLSVCPACTAKFAMMRWLEMKGAYALTDAVIEKVLVQTSPGNYALGYMDGGIFVVFYVGRADSDLRACLHEWVGVTPHYDRYACSARAPWRWHHRGAFPTGVPTLARVESSDDSYTHFAFSYARSADEAYAKECRNYETFGGLHGLDNEVAPTAVAHPTSSIFSEAP